jgi:hypothetical protein
VRTPEGYRPPAGGGGGGSVTTTGVTYVSTTGDDATGAVNDISLPFRTLGAALAVVASGVVEVWPGTYPEQGLTLPVGVTLRGLSWEATRIGTTAAAVDVLAMGQGSAIENLAFNVPATAGLAAIRFTGGAGQTGVANYLTFYGDGIAGQGDGFVKTGGGKLIGDVWRLEGGGVRTMATVDGGVLALGGVHCPASPGAVTAFTETQAGGRMQIVSHNCGNALAGAAHLSSGGTTRIFVANWFQVPIGLQVTADPVDIEITGGDIDPGALAVSIGAGLTGAGSIYLISATVSPLFQFPPGYAQTASYVVLAQQKDAPTRNAAQRVFGADFRTGSPERGASVIAGELGPYADKITIATTDATAGTASDGGNIIDETAAGADKTTGATLGFQSIVGTPAAGPSILWSSGRTDASGGILPNYGLRVLQAARALDGAGNSATGDLFAVEIWATDGISSEWRAVPVQASNAVIGSSYAFNILGRDNSDETIRLGLGKNLEITADPAWTWEEKLITVSGTPTAGLWARIRVIGTLTQGPTFEWWRLAASFTELDRVGRRQSSGLGVWRLRDSRVGSLWGNTAGIGNYTAAVGAGAAYPDQVNFNIARSLLNGVGDRLDIQFILPEGWLSCLPTTVRVYLAADSVTVANTAAQITAAIYPLESAGVQIADPAGGVDTIPAPYATTAGLTADAGLSLGAVDVLPTGETVPVSFSDRLFFMEFGPFDLQAFYPAQVVGVAVELTADSSPAIDWAVWAIELSGFAFTEGMPLD